MWTTADGEGQGKVEVYGVSEMHNAYLLAKCSAPHNARLRATFNRDFLLKGVKRTYAGGMQGGSKYVMRLRGGGSKF